MVVSIRIFLLSVLKSSFTLTLLINSKSLGFGSLIISSFFKKSIPILLSSPIPASFVFDPPIDRTSTLSIIFAMQDEFRSKVLISELFIPINCDVSR